MGDNVESGKVLDVYFL